AGGRGYTRPPSLVSLWSSAPFLLNNSVGPFDPDPSVEGRMRSFQASIEQMLWPERRQHDSKLGSKIPGTIDRTTTTTFLKVSGGYLPDALRSTQGLGQRVAPWLFGDGCLELGPIPAGTPIGLLANLNPLAEGADPVKHAEQLLKLAVTLTGDLRK